MADFDILEKALFGIFQKGVLEGLWGHDTSGGGDPQGGGRSQGWSSTMELHMALPYGIFLL